MSQHRKLTNEELKRLEVDEYMEAPKNPVIVVLDNIRSLNNIGSVFRSSDAFRIEKLILCGISTPPPHREIHKSALGAELSVAWEYHKETSLAVLRLKNEGYTLVGIEQTESSIPLNKARMTIPDSPLALIFGHEIHGVGQEVINLCDHCVEIPQFGTKHSFNVAVSVGIVLWEFSQKWFSD